MNMTLAEAVRAMGAYGDIDDVQQGCKIGAVRTDSRAVGTGDLFVCLPGENFDGHNFAAQAADNGAIAVVAERPLPEVFGRVPVLIVRDSLAAIGRLGAFWRTRTKAQVVAVTGSAGKTSVKEMLAAILSEVGETAKNYKNFNNQLGVPMCMLEFTGEERFWVVELGISMPHDMNELGAIVRPDFAVINNIGPAHLEGLGDIDGVARCKTDILDFVAEGGRAFVSMDYPELWEKATSRFAETVGFSAKDRSARFTARYLGAGEKGGRYELCLDGQTVELDVPFCGAYFAENILAAATAAYELGAGMPEIERGLMKARLPEHRNACISAGGFMLVDDTYNANPLAMQRAVEGAAEMAGDRPLVLVLGEMRELGSGAAEHHRHLGETIVKVGATAVFYSGGQSEAVSAGLGNGSYGGTFSVLGEPAAFPEAFSGLGLQGGVVLFKGSRSTKMERYVQSLADWLSGEGKA